MIDYNVTASIDHALHEVRAARRDLTITVFCMRQAEMLRRIDRAKASLADLVQSRNGGANRAESFCGCDDFRILPRSIAGAGG